MRQVGNGCTDGKGKNHLLPPPRKVGDNDGEYPLSERAVPL